MGLKLGAVWGLGHGLSAILLGLFAYLIKGQVSTKFKFLSNITSLSEYLIGFSLIAIGALGIKENLFDTNEIEETFETSKQQGKRAIFFNGMLHGFSWDGAPSLAPALAMTTWTSILGFLFSYCLGTMIAMSITGGLLSEGSTRLGKAINYPNFPRDLSVASSLVAMSLGIFWIVKSALLS